MTYFKAIIKEETQTEYGIVPKSQEYYIPAETYSDAEIIFKRLIVENMICIGCLSNEAGVKMFELKKILKEEIADVVGDDSEFYYKVVVKYFDGEDNKKSINSNIYVSAEDCCKVFEKATNFIKEVGYLADHEIMSITKKDKIKKIFSNKDEDYAEIVKEII